MRNRIFATLVTPVAASILLLGSPLALQADEGQQLRTLVGELRERLERAERERLADPWFIDDLRKLLHGYDWPWQADVYSRDYVAENLREVPPEWQVSSGRVAMDWNRGLRSTAEAPRGPAEQRTPSGEELVGALVGSILEQALGGRQRGERAPGQAQDAGAQAGPARYQLPIAIPNAFALRVNLSQRPPQGGIGRYAVGVFQGSPEGSGYRLEMTAGAAPNEVGFALVRQSSRGTTQTVDFYDGERRLQPDRAQELMWTRDANGHMVVSLDGESLFEVEDRSFRDAWNGLTVINAGGDLAFSKIVLQAAR